MPLQVLILFGALVAVCMDTVISTFYRLLIASLPIKRKDHSFLLAFCNMFVLMIMIEIVYF